jgi:hypothetical protein
MLYGCREGRGGSRGEGDSVDLLRQAEELYDCVSLHMKAVAGTSLCVPGPRRKLI